MHRHAQNVRVGGVRVVVSEPRPGVVGGQVADVGDLFAIYWARRLPNHLASEYGVVPPRNGMRSMRQASGCSTTRRDMTEEEVGRPPGADPASSISSRAIASGTDSRGSSRSPDKKRYSCVEAQTVHDTWLGGGDEVQPMHQLWRCSFERALGVGVGVLDKRGIEET